VAGTEAEIQVLITARDLASGLLASARASVQRLGGAIGDSADQTRRASAGMDQLRRNLRDFAAASHSGMSSLFAAGGLAGLSGALVAAGLGFNSLREQALISFEQILGSSDRASDAFGRFTRIAAETPFQQGDVVQMGQRLLVVGYNIDEATRLARLFSDVISSIPNAGADQLNSITSAFARMRETGTATLGDIESLSYQGIPAIQILAEQFGTNTRAMRRILMRDLPAELIMSRLEAGLQAHFGGLGKRQVDTFRGVLSNIRDIVTQDLGQVMLPFFVSLRDLLRGVVDHLSSLKLQMQQLPQPVKDVIKQMGPWLVLLVPIGLAIGGVVSAISGFMTLLAPLGALLLGVVAFLTPWGPALALIAIAAYTLYLAWRDNWFGIRDALTAVWEVIAPILQAIWDFVYGVGTGKISLTVALGEGWDWVQWVAGQVGKGLQVAFSATMGLLGEGWDWVKKIAGLVAGVLKFAIEGWLKVFGLGWDDIEWLMGQVKTAAKFAWDATVSLLGDGWGWIKWLAGQVTAPIKPAWDTVATLAAGGWDWIVWLAGQIAAPIAPAWETVATLAAGGWDWVVWLAGQVAAPIAPAWNTVASLVAGGWDWVQWLAGQITSPIAPAWDAVVNLIGTGWDWLTWLVQQWAKPWSFAWDAAVNLIDDGWAWVKWIAGNAAKLFNISLQLGITWASDWVKKILDWIAATGGRIINVGGSGSSGGGGAQGFNNGVPLMAEGGITRGQGLAYLHPMEAVIPLDRLPGVGGGTGGGPVHVHLYGNVYPNDIVDLVARGLDQARREARVS
jgi:tape measure domain-containing protein